MEILKLAADEGVTAVENALEQLLADPRGMVCAKEVKGVLDAWQDIKEEWRNRAPLEVRLEDYDKLLDGFEESEESEEGFEKMSKAANREEDAA